jgi:DNA-binding CsgD family transcriptional regulator
MKKWPDLETKYKIIIENLYKQGKSVSEIAARFEIKPQTISQQAYLKKWTRPAKKEK